VRVGQWWLQRKDVEDIATKLGITVTPIVLEGTLQEISNLVDKGFNSQWGDFIAEGVVARPREELRNRKLERVITKLKHKDFLKLKV